jgi:hypothetical protein
MPAPITANMASTICLECGRKSGPSFRCFFFWDKRCLGTYVTYTCIGILRATVLPICAVCNSIRFRASNLRRDPGDFEGPLKGVWPMLVRAGAIVFLFHAAALPSTGSDVVEPPPTGSQVSRLGKRLFRKPALIRVGAGAAYSYIINSPHEWGRGISGLGKRAGSGMGFHIIKGSVEYTVGTIRHEQFGYRRSYKVGFKPRLTHALLSTVITRNTRTGNKTAASGKISGTLAAAMISRLWNPVRLHTVASGFSSAGISLGVDAGSNVVREFWPEIRHRRRSARPGAIPASAAKAN